MHGYLELINICKRINTYPISSSFKSFFMVKKRENKIKFYFAPMEKHFMVNDKRINIKGCNEDRIQIIGDRNRINIQCNSGSVEVVGNHCNVNISENTSDANVTYIGNHGKIHIGLNSSVASIRYSGNNGSIQFINEQSNTSRNHGTSNGSNVKNCNKI